MKNVSPIGVVSLILILACSKKEPAITDSTQEITLNYDTTAIDSFSTGAISVDVARQIRMSSQKYQDSLKEAAKIQLEEQRIKEELDKESDKKKEEEKKNKADQAAKPPVED